MGTSLDEVEIYLGEALDRWDSLSQALRILVDESGAYGEEQIADQDDLEGAYWVFLDRMREQLDDIEEHLSWVHHGARHRKDIEARQALRAEKQDLLLRIEELELELEKKGGEVMTLEEGA